MVELAEHLPEPSAPPELVSALEGRYLVEGVLGEGGMGVVYRARHLSLGRPVAVKVLHDRAAKDPHLIERFRREALSASRIESPHVVKIHDLGRLETGAAYIVMEHLDGVELTDILEEKVFLEESRVVRIGLQLCQVLGMAHQQGVVHRDLKPENVIVMQREGHDHVKVVDFGIAKVMDAVGITKAGSAMGTPSYMSPEQCAGDAADGRSDIYALGIMLYEMVTGQLPFNDENIAAMLLAHFAEPPPPPCEVADWVHPTFENIILRCLEKKKEDRYQSMEELAEALRDFAGISDGPLNRVLGSGESCPSLPAVDDSPSLASLPPVTGMESTIPPPSTSGDCPAPSVWPEHVSGVRAAVDPIRSDTFGIGPREPSAAAASGTAAAWSRPEPMRPEPSPSPHPAGMLSARTPPPARAPSRVSKKTSRWYLAAVATLCFVGTVLAVVGLVIFLQRSAPLPVASPEPETIVVDVSGASPASADLEEPDLVRVQPVGRTLTIETDPVGAVVEVDGESVGVTPLSIARPAEGSTVVMRLTAPGYRPREVRLGHAAAPTVRLGLNRAVAPNLPPAARASVPESPPAHRANSLRSRSPNRARPTMDVLNPWGT